jgi:hypothetical protein
MLPKYKDRSKIDHPMTLFLTTTHRSGTLSAPMPTRAVSLSDNACVAVSRCAIGIELLILPL